MFSDYIKIHGLNAIPPDDVNPADFEMFQGLGAEFLAQQTVDPETGLLPITPATPFPEALWLGQNKLIEAESTYSLSLETLFKQQQVAMPKEPTIIGEVLQEFGSMAEELLAWTFGGFVTGITGTLGTPLEQPVFVLSRWAAEIGISYCWGKLGLLFTKGIDLCQAIKAENDAMLSLEVSLENYTLRKQNLQLHTEMLENVVNQIATMEEMLDRNIQKSTDMKGVIKALKPVDNLTQLKGINEDTDNLEKLKDAIETMSEEHEKLRKAVEDLTFVDATLKYADNTSLHIGGKVLNR